MILCLAGLLDRPLLGRVDALLQAARFEDGARTAGWHARRMKDNAQAVPDPATREAGTLIEAALRANPVFHSGVLPRRLRPMLFSRYGVGQGYGAHLDDAVMGGTAPLRTDVAVTVFLSAPSAYAGGELVLDTTAGEQAFKLEAGDAVAYPATTVHRVAAVDAGERLAAVTWVQSLVRDAGRREVLFDLDAARHAVFAGEGNGPTFDRITRTHANLLRMWANT